MEVTRARDTSRPNLQPIWTGHQARLDRRASPHLRGPGEALSSPRSPRRLPSPLHPRGSARERSMRQHERAMVESLAVAGTKPSPPPHGLPRLSPATEQQRTPGPESESRRASTLSASPPAGPHLASFAPLTPPTPGQGPTQLPRQQQTIVTETRNILLSGLPRLQASNVGAAVERPQSLPSPPPALPTPVSVRRRDSAAIRDQLEAWGHVYFGDATSADCFVAARSLRTVSDSSSENSSPVEESPKGSPKGDASTSPHPDRVVIRARVRPRELERKPFILQRSFNMDELRSTIPAPSPVSATFPRAPMDLDARAGNASPGLSGGGGSRSPVLPFVRRLSSSSAGSTAKTASTWHSLNRSLVRGANVVPMRKCFAAHTTCLRPWAI